MPASASLVDQRQIDMEKRRHLHLERVSGERNRVTQDRVLTLWFDASSLSDIAETRRILGHPVIQRYTGILINPRTEAEFVNAVPTDCSLVIQCRTAEDLAACRSERGLSLGGRSIECVSSEDEGILEDAKTFGVKTCLRRFVDDGPSLHKTVETAAAYDYLLVGFRDPTNIPLELIIATLQATQTILIKEIRNRRDVDDAIVSLGVMEVGAEGVMFTAESTQVADAFLSRLDALHSGNLQLSVGTVVESRPAGMGYRSCIDVATLFSEVEGILVGSTSQGGILCCPEVFYLPYMQLRPFRVNAGAVHSYVFGANDRTDYMTELRSGSPVMIVDKAGRARRACVGRMKTELRPLRLIEVEFEAKKRVSVLMQDDWHVRVFSAEGAPLNITELKTGDQVLGYVTEPGRHVGIRVNEHIFEV
jgi:3-dehydroquinate synthase II/3-amino-4-hydroxybenzoic acid synthase